MATIISNVYAFDSMRYFEVNRRRQRVLMSLAELHAIKGLIFLQYSLKITAVNIIFPQISANSAYLPQTWAKWAVLAVLFSWQHPSIRDGVLRSGMLLYLHLIQK